MANFSRQMRLSSTLLRLLQQRVTAVNSTSSRKFTTTEGHRPTIVHKRSHDILHDPWFNKGTAFSFTERDRLHIRGLLPPNVMSFEQQTARFSKSLSTI
uniref:NAD-dependent malic enzyme 62 kDa isoform, mitochondrial-like n=1 Tax=Nicotiana tabacum TaxID=4097 RepID=A0A1S4DEL6_TOBAC|nr:PREDICTED: NAD-dependent malic enzyme 62 kDa isoform, mitochondrial-like [Nicotiana tabacum]